MVLFLSSSQKVLYQLNIVYYYYSMIPHISNRCGTLGVYQPSSTHNFVTRYRNHVMKTINSCFKRTCAKLRKQKEIHWFVRRNWGRESIASYALNSFGEL